jgi:type III pantothenate kinase
MKPHVVADVGNSRIKWGLCSADGLSIRATASLPEDPAAWQARLALWADCTELAGAGGGLLWVLASVRPQRCDLLRVWLESRGHRVLQLMRADQLPLATAVVAPDHVGIDRLLDAVAAKRRLAPGVPAILVDAGSAVTIDWLDERHIFCGGAIFPGLRLMAQSLHDYTALLPLVTVREPVPSFPAPDTIPAMETGIFHTVVGGIEKACRVLVEKSSVRPQLFLTGGDARLLLSGLKAPVPAVLWPDQTLAGILASVEAVSP